MRTKVPVVLLAVLLAAAAAFVILSDDGSEEPAPVPPVDPEPEVPEGPALPDGYRFDPSSGTLSCDRITDWKVFDEYHAYMNPDRSVYTGYDVPSADSVNLGPGRYTVVSEGNEMDIQVPGAVSRTMSWTFDMDGTEHKVSLDFSIPMDLYQEAAEGSAVFNAGLEGRTPMFHELPGMVQVDPVIRDIESGLASEYLRIGGSLLDRQGYADFIASAVQLTVKYPPWIDRQTDTFVWGVPEYWCVPLETLYHMEGDCEDTSVLLCALYQAAGYRAAVGGHAGHVFAGVHLDTFEETSRDRLDELGVQPQLSLSSSFGVSSITSDGKTATLSDELFYSVETIYDQVPVGYLGGGSKNLDQPTFWGWAGFYTCDTRVV